MNLWLSSLLLVVALFLSSSALTVEECKPLITPKSTFEPSFGKWIFIMGYMSSEPFKVLFRSAQSQWITFRKGSTNHSLFEDIGIRHPTYCKYATSKVSITGNTAVTSKSNFTCTYTSLPTCKDCLLYMVNSRNNNELLNFMNITVPKTIHEETRYRAVYLMAKENTVSQPDLDHFKKQAKCLGFKGDPDFTYDPANTLCNPDKE